MTYFSYIKISHIIYSELTSLQFYNNWNVVINVAQAVLSAQRNTLKTVRSTKIHLVPR